MGETLSPRWTGLHKVLLGTPYSVAVQGPRGRKWLHLTQTRKANVPGTESLQQTWERLAAERENQDATSSEDDGDPVREDDATRA